MKLPINAASDSDKVSADEFEKPSSIAAIVCGTFSGLSTCTHMLPTIPAARRFVEIVSPEQQKVGRRLAAHHSDNSQRHIERIKGALELDLLPR